MSSNSTLGIILNNSSRLNVPLVEKIDQCDYTLLFSHLWNSIQYAHVDILKNGQNFHFEEESTYKITCAIVCILFGLFFAICGYRFLKLSTFIVGFSLGSGIIYLILSEQKQLSTVENITISLSIGVLFAFVALLVQYIGLFLIGITSSISIVTCILILIDLFYTNQSAWVCIGLLFICATVLASITLKFQKSLTIINTSIIGSALLFVAVDFIVENNLLIDYIHQLFKVNGHIFNIYERQKALLQTSNNGNILSTTTISSIKKLATNTPILESTLQQGNSTINNSALALLQRLYSSANARLCWYTWVVFGSFFVILFFSLLIQFLCTGRNYDHRESWQKLIRGSRKKKTANLEKIRLKSHLSDSETHRTHLTSNHQTYTSSARSSISSASHLDLVATNQNDTLLLVESGANTHLTYTSSSRASEESTKLPLNKKTSQKANEIESDFEIVSFEVMKSAKSVRKTTKPASNRQPPTKMGRNKLNAKLSSATTASTSSTNSSSSSTCQLIPMKLNNGSVGTASTTVGNCLVNCPASPMVLPAVKSQHHGTLQPPPVPTLPPPKLPVNLTISSKTDTINSSLSMTNSILVPVLPVGGGVNKKSHRHNGGLNGGKPDPKAQGSDKFRQLYQIRRNHGDVLSQDFLKNIQSKQNSSSTQLDSSFIESNTFELRSASLSTSDKKAKLKQKQTK